MREERESRAAMSIVYQGSVISFHTVVIIPEKKQIRYKRRKRSSEMQELEQ